MGLRGVWAGLRREAHEKIEAGPKRRLPWKKKGLNRSQRVIAFLEFLPVTKGILVGTAMKLLPEQRKFVEAIYRDGSKVRIAIQSEPRGNGKTGLLAGLCLCHLLGPEAEARGEIYAAAVDRTQSAKMFDEVEAILLEVPEFQCRVNVGRFHKRVEVLDGDGEGSKFEALSADARKGHGLAPTLWVYDELAQVDSRELLDNLQTAMGKRKRSLGIIISTQAANDDHPLSKIIDDGLVGGDPSVLVHLLTAPTDADPFDHATIRKVNPALGHFLNEVDLFREAATARRIPANESAFRNLRLNQRVDSSQEDRIVPGAVWKRGAVPIDVGRLEGRKAYAGLDLSGTEDLTALLLAFPDDEEDRGYDVVPFFWTPLDALENRTQAERDLFKVWIKQGHLLGVPGPVIRYRFVAQKLAELSKRYDLVLGFDRWGMRFLEPELADAGVAIPMEPFGQGYESMSPALQYFAELALTGRLRHGGHPVLTACVANAIVITDAAGNRKIDKGRSNKRATTRIDGAAALAMALGTAKRFVLEAEPPKTYQMIFA